ncbi:cytochrome b [Marinobacterium sp. AK62]|uniref:Cytochrome b n=1 Tax=Marinobacterium alkalitolerans TaxID=1542925 RepID=A0ABS3ZDQ9_9GAMM|nr:cytochrome b [Marinobacterium alkalitolerans]MBP0049817.1 cytochrome b [Marinobacterium alkalitolerans]
MQLNNHTSSYGWIAILLHWLMAIAIIGLAIVGLWMVDLNYYSPWYKTAPFWHKSIGLLLLVLLAFRLFWRWRQPTPQAPVGHQPWEKRLASLTHGLLYGLLAVILLSGYLISTAKGDGISFFGLFEVPALISGLDNQADLSGWIHFWAAMILLGLAALHAAGALKHHLLDRDTTLIRMLKPTPIQTEEH